MFRKVSKIELVREWRGKKEWASVQAAAFTAATALALLHLFPTNDRQQFPCKLATFYEFPSCKICIP